MFLILWRMLFVLLVGQNVSADRILAFISTASYSHQMFYQQFWRELAIRGHEIVVITTDPTNEKLSHFKEISISELYVPMKEYMNDIMNLSTIEMAVNNPWTEMTLSLSEFILQLPQVQQLINDHNEHFDLLIIEHFLTPMLGLQHRFKCPMIGVMSFDALNPSHEVMGNSVHSLLYPSPMLPIDTKSSVYFRTMVVILNNVFNLSPYRCIYRMNSIGKKFFGSDMPAITDIYEKTDMLFVNANPVLSAVRPHTPSTISIAGGMHMKPEKPLPKDIKEFLDDAKEGAIYFSLGSNVKSNEITAELRQTIIKTLAQIPYKILWKFEEDDLLEKPDNVKLIKWAPQQDILRHKHIQMFITQGGLQSLEEALYSHVPLVVMPFFGDQYGNAEIVRTKGLGVVLDRHNLNVNGFMKAILEVMKNPVYKDTIKRLAMQIQDTPMTALERAVWWTEYVLRHKGAQHLKGPKIPLYQYYYLDVIAFFGTSISIILCLLSTIVFIIIKRVCSWIKCKLPKRYKLKK